MKKQKLLKGWHQSGNVTVLAILECLKLKNLSYRPTMASGNTFRWSIASPLWNQFCRPVTTQKTSNNRHISSRRSDNCNSKFSINVDFEKDNGLDFQYFRKSGRNLRSKCPILRKEKVTNVFQVFQGTLSVPVMIFSKKKQRTKNIYSGNQENGGATFMDTCIDSTKMSLLVCFGDTFYYIQSFHCRYFLKRWNSLHGFICYSIIT